MSPATRRSSRRSRRRSGCTASARWPTRSRSSCPARAFATTPTSRTRSAREFQWNTLIPETIEAEVRNGVVAVWGEVEWAYRREEAEQAVRYLRGVTGVTNLITVKPRVKPSEIEQRIREAIAPAAALDARQIWVTTSNGTVHLHGHVHSLFEKKVADDAAKSAPGVIEVDNEIEVTP